MENGKLLKYLNTSTSIFLVINSDHSVELVNKKGCEVLGYERDEIEGKNWFDHFIPEDERKELANFFDTIIARKLSPPESHENKILVRDGQVKLIQWRNTLLENENGTVVGLISSGTDISAEAKAHDLLYIRNRALEVAGNGIIIVDAKDSKLPIIYSNPAFTRLTGYRRSEVIGKNCRFLQNDDRTQDAIVTMAKAIQKGEPCRVTLRNYRKDGSLFWNELTITPLYDEEQQLTHFIGVQNDVTKIQKQKQQLEDYSENLEKMVQKRTEEVKDTVQKLIKVNSDLKNQIATTKYAENKVKKSQDLTSAIAKNFPNGVVVVFNTKYELVFVEGEEIKNINLKRADFEGEHIDDIPLFSDAHKASIKRDIRDTLNGQSISSEVEFLNRFYTVNSTPLYAEDRKISSALFVYHNTTEQKRIREELTKALKSEQELNELKSRFISMASHEFRTPLSGILSSAILIGKQNEPGLEERRAKHVSRIKTNVKNLVVILNDFLSLSKLEEGKVRAKPERFELIEFSKLLIEEMESSKKEGQEIDLKTEVEEIWMDQDSKLLNHILINLLTNAIKYSPEESKIIFELQDGEQEVMIRISDKGMGIPIAEQKNLFDRFFRAENVTNIQGTGLGLHIVKHYTELMNGNVSFISELGKGSTFTVRLPLKFKENENYSID